MSHLQAHANAGLRGQGSLRLPHGQGSAWFSCMVGTVSFSQLGVRESVICFCILGNLKGLRQVICLWIKYSKFTNGKNLLHVSI